MTFSDKLSDYDDLHEKATDLLIKVLPNYFPNTTDYSDWSFESIIAHIQEEYDHSQANTTLSLHDSGSLDTFGTSFIQVRVAKYKTNYGRTKLNAIVVMFLSSINTYLRFQCD